MDIVTWWKEYSQHDQAVLRRHWRNAQGDMALLATQAYASEPYWILLILVNQGDLPENRHYEVFSLLAEAEAAATQRAELIARLAGMEEVPS